MAATTSLDYASVMPI